MIGDGRGIGFWWLAVAALELVVFAEALWGAVACAGGVTWLGAEAVCAAMEGTNEGAAAR